MEEWNTIEPNTWKPANIGDLIEGVLIDKAPAEKERSMSAKYWLETANGRFLVWGGAVLDDRMRFVNVGDKIRIIFKGTDKNKRNQNVNIFEVQVARNSPHVSSPSPAGSSGSVPYIQKPKASIPQQPYRTATRSNNSPPVKEEDVV